MTHTYESVFICPGDISQEKVESTLEKIKSIITRANGKIVTAELWGKRRLSHPIDRNREGFYGYLIFSSTSEIPAVLDRHYQVTDQVLRGMTVKVDPRHLEKIRPSYRTAMTEGAPGQEAAPTAAAAAVPQEPAAAKPAVPAASAPGGEAGTPA